MHTRTSSFVRVNRYAVCSCKLWQREGSEEVEEEEEEEEEKGKKVTGDGGVFTRCIPRENPRKVSQREPPFGILPNGIRTRNFSLASASPAEKRKQDLFRGSVTGIPGEKLREIRRARKLTPNIAYYFK